MFEFSGRILANSVEVYARTYAELQEKMCADLVSETVAFVASWTAGETA